MNKILLTLTCMALLAAPATAAVVDGNRIMDQRMAENLCALTFDDGPSRNTGALLDLLATYGIKASFFLLGKNVNTYNAMTKRIAEEGHEIGNHSWSHPNLRQLPSEQVKEELGNTDSLLRSLGITPLYMRPPYGAFDSRTIDVANELGVDVVLWSLDSHDWKSLPADYAKLRSTRGTVYDEGALRGIFLFHDTHKSTVEDLPRIIANLRAGGCERFVTVSEYLAGLEDHEPALLMTRHETVPQPALARVRPAPKAYPAGTAIVPLARCSRPWDFTDAPGKELRLDDAQAAVESTTGS